MDGMDREQWLRGKEYGWDEQGAMVERKVIWMGWTGIDG